MIERFTASLVRHRRRWSLAAGALLLLAIWLGSRLTLRLEMADYLPRGTAPPPVAVPGQGGADRIVVVVEAGAPMQAAEIGPLLDSLAVRLGQLPGIRRVEYRVGAGLARYLEAEAPRHLLLYFTSAELDSLGQHLSREYLERALLHRGAPIPRTPLALALGIEHTDPLGVISPALLTLRRLRGLPQIRLVDGYYSVADQQAFFLSLEPAQSLAGIASDREITRAIRQVLKDAAAAPALRELLRGKRLLALGRPVAVVEGVAIALNDLQRVALASTLVVFGLLVLFLRRLAAPLFLMATVLYGVALTAGAAFLLFRSVGLVSWVFIAVLIGFGDEFALYVVSHYWITAPPGADRAEALAAAIRRPGPGILLGGLTSAAAFFSLVVMSYPVMVELAWLTTIGLLIVLACAFTVLPLGLAFTKPGTLRQPRWYQLWQPRGVVGRHHLLWLTGWGILVLGSAALATKLRFEPHPWKLAVRGIPESAEYQQLSQRLGASFTPFLMVSEGGTEQEALASDRAAVRALDSIQFPAGIAGVVSLSRLLPPAEQQAANVAYVREHPELFSPERFRRDFLEVMARRDPDTLLLRRYLPLVQRFLVVPEPVSLETIRAAGMDDFVAHHLVRQGNRYFAISEVYPDRIPWSAGVVERFTAAVAEAGDPALERARFVGESLRGATHTKVLRRDLLLATALGVLLNLLLLALRFRRPWLVALCLVPMVSGIAVVLGLMALLGLELNILTIAVAPLLVGLGSDDGIHIVDRLERGESLATVLAETGPPMFLTTLTTIAAFACLGFARFAGVAEMGLVTAFGLVVCLAASMQLVPLLYQLGGTRSAR